MRGRSSGQVVPQSMYLIGECFLAMGDAKAALDQFNRTQQGFPESMEGVAATFQSADLLRRLNQDEEAIAAFRRGRPPWAIRPNFAIRSSRSTRSGSGCSTRIKAI